MVTLDMIPKTAALKIQVSQGDTGARRFIFALRAGNAPYTLTTETVTFVQSNGVEHACTIADGKAVLDCYADMSAAAGIYRCKLRIEDGNGGVLNTAAFRLKVEEQP